MRYVLALIILLGFTSTAQSQSNANSSDSTQTVYFLVDASGSMREELAEASAKVDAKITLLNPDSWKSVTYFGGKSIGDGGRVGCDHDITIATATPVEIGSPPFPTLGGNDNKTAIGKALEAALMAAGENDSIVLITDGAEECDSDFVSIRRRYPKADIEVFQVGESPNTALELLEIMPQPHSPASAQNLPIPLPTAIQQSPSVWETTDWLAKWNWLIGVSIMLFSVIGFGIQQGLKSHVLEGELKTLRDEKRKSQDGTIAVGASEKRFQVAQDKLKKFGPVWLPIILFGIGFLWIVVLTFGSEEYFGVSRDMAWLVLSSSFAIVFSVLTSTPLFFASSQYWRSVQIKQTFDSEVDITKIVELQQQRAQNAKEYRAYKELRRTVGDTKFSSSWPSGSSSGRGQEDADAVSVVEEEAAKIASKTLLPEDKPKAIAEETTRLKRYRVEWPTKPRLDVWIHLLVEDKLLTSRNWLELAKRIEAGELEELKASFAVVRDEIQKDSEGVAR